MSYSTSQPLPDDLSLVTSSFTSPSTQPGSPSNHSETLPSNLQHKLVQRARTFLATIMNEGPNVFPQIHIEGLEWVYLPILADILKRNAALALGRQDVAISYLDALEIMELACPENHVKERNVIREMCGSHRKSGAVGPSLRTIANRLDDYCQAVELWFVADHNNSGTVDFKGLQFLVDERKMDLSTVTLRRIFDEIDLIGDGDVGFAEFVRFYINVSTMRELRPVYSRYATAEDGNEMCLVDLFRFLRCEQHEDIPLGGPFFEKPIDPVLLHLRIAGDNGLEVHTHGNYSRTLQHDASINTRHITGTYTLWMFQKYLLSAHNVWIDGVQLRERNHDMDRPLGEYFINSSHNTYLSGDQLLSESKCEMYRDCLLQGCRCVEIDCWDGADGEPIVYHGWTRTTKIRFRDVIETIHRYSFVTSPYPVILSLEVHTNRTQSLRMARIMMDIFGSVMVTAELHHNLGAVALEDYFTPKKLMYKILVKHKQAEAVPNSARENDPGGSVGSSKMESGSAQSHTTSDEDEDEDEEYSSSGVLDPLHEDDEESIRAHIPSSPTNRMSLTTSSSIHAGPTLSSLVSLSSVKVKGVDPGHHPPYSIVSLPETRIDHYERVPDLAQGLIALNRKMFTRIYPKGTRVDSSNYYPQASWNLGCSFVALNFQKPDFPMRLNRRKFLENGSSGYLLKPAFLRFASETWQPPQDHRRLHVQVIAAMHLPHQTSRRRKASFDPHVELFISGFGEDDTSATTSRTNILTDSAWHSIWQQDFTFEINCIDLAMLTLRVVDYDPVRPELIGENTAPVKALRQGYRKVPLYDLEENEIPLAFLLCRFRLVTSEPIPSWL